MTFVRGNRAVRDHASDGKDLHLFEQADRGFVRYVGEMVTIGFHERQAPDTDGQPRRAVVFELAPLAEFKDDEAATRRGGEEPGVALQDLSLEELRRRALADSVPTRTATERRAQIRVRSVAIKLYVQRRANGTCEGCGAPAPFRRPDARPYLEPHHIRRLSDGGPDHPRWVTAVCPNCHRRAHYAEDAAAYNARLGDIVGRLETDQ